MLMPLRNTKKISGQPLIPHPRYPLSGLSTKNFFLRITLMVKKKKKKIYGYSFFYLYI